LKENTLSTVHDILIIGSGAAGYTAAIYAGRANRKPVLLSGLQHGGQLTITTEVENFPGFGEPIMGPELMDRMKQQAIRSGATLIEDLILVDRVDFTRRPFTVWTDDGREWNARVVIVATGASAKWIGLPSEQKFMGHGVSACATCDGPRWKRRTTSPNSAARSWWCIAATRCAPRRRCRTAPCETRRSASCGTAR
jgi:thioredoxin reductase (NADPH)